MKCISILTVLCTVILFCSCSTTKPVLIGKDTYMLAVGGGWSSGRTIKMDLYRQADEFCREKGLYLMPVDANSNEAEYFKYASAEITFRCLPENDPELKRPDPNPNVRIEMKSK